MIYRDCPTCGGRVFIPHSSSSFTWAKEKCPDCDFGVVPIADARERIAAGVSSGLRALVFTGTDTTAHGVIWPASIVDAVLAALEGEP